MSGSGKSTAIRALEDAGFFCIDNLPVLLLPKLTELAGGGQHRAHGAGGRRARGRLPHGGAARAGRGPPRRAPGGGALPGRQRREPHPPLQRDAPPPPAGPRRAAWPRASRRSARPLQRPARDGRPGHRLLARSTCTTSSAWCRRASARSRPAGPRSRVMSFGYRLRRAAAGGPGASTCASCPTRTSCPELKGLTGKNPKVAAYVLDREETQQFLDEDRGPLPLPLPALPEGGQGVPHRGAGLHRRQAPLGGHRGGADAAAERHAQPRVQLWDRDIEKE